MQPRPGTTTLGERLATLGSIALVVSACGSVTSPAANPPTSAPPPAAHVATPEPTVATATRQPIALPDGCDLNDLHNAIQIIKNP